MSATGRFWTVFGSQPSGSFVLNCAKLQRHPLAEPEAGDAVSLVTPPITLAWEMVGRHRAQLRIPSMLRKSQRSFAFDDSNTTRSGIRRQSNAASQVTADDDAPGRNNQKANSARCKLAGVLSPSCLLCGEIAAFGVTDPCRLLSAAQSQWRCQLFKAC